MQYLYLKASHADIVAFRHATQGTLQPVAFTERPAETPLGAILAPNGLELVILLGKERPEKERIEELWNTCVPSKSALRVMLLQTPSEATLLVPMAGRLYHARMPSGSATNLIRHAMNLPIEDAKALLATFVNPLV